MFYWKLKSLANNYTKMVYYSTPPIIVLLDLMILFGAAKIPAVSK